MAESLVAIAHGLVQAGTGVLVGKSLDMLADRLTQLNSSPALRVIVQISVGIPVLGEVMRGLSGGGLDSPIGDAPLIYFFYRSQPSLFKHIDVVEGQLYAYFCGATS